jgi:hypothetical protein
MQDHPNKQIENPPLDAEDWEDAFEPYAAKQTRRSCLALT